MSAMVQMASRRRIDRQPTNWDAVAQLGDLVVRGTVRDFTRLGLFFEPEVSWDGTFVQGADVLDDLLVGDILTVTLMDRQGHPQCRVPSTVRWMRASSQHDCQGLGVEFYGKVP